METKRIAILGAGNIGGAILHGLLKAKIPAENIIVTRRHQEALNDYQKIGVRITTDNVKAVKESEIIIIAVKPKQVLDLLYSFKNYLNVESHIIVSIATGISINSMRKEIGSKIPIFRAMPNTAISICQSMTCISVSAHANAKEIIFTLFGLLGSVVNIDEELMGAATVLGACGLAFALRFIRAASQGGIEIGFDAKTSELIASQICKGAAALLQESGKHPEEEIDKITTPQGCTISGLNEMEHEGFSSSLIKGISASYKKIPKISND